MRDARAVLPPPTGYDGGGIGKGAAVALYVDGNRVAEGRVDRTHLFIFSMDDAALLAGQTGREETIRRALDFWSKS